MTKPYNPLPTPYLGDQVLNNYPIEFPGVAEKYEAFTMYADVVRMEKCAIIHIQPFRMTPTATFANEAVSSLLSPFFTKDLDWADIIMGGVADSGTVVRTFTLVIAKAGLENQPGRIVISKTGADVTATEHTFNAITAVAPYQS
jgi:hypothetical protein